jgi:hypothetical protein
MPKHARVIEDVYISTRGAGQCIYEGEGPGNRGNIRKRSGPKRATRVRPSFKLRSASPSDQLQLVIV